MESLFGSPKVHTLQHNLMNCNFLQLLTIFELEIELAFWTTFNRCIAKNKIIVLNYFKNSLTTCSLQQKNVDNEWVIFIN